MVADASRRGHTIFEFSVSRRPCYFPAETPSGSLNSFRGLVMNAREIPDIILNPGDPQNYRITENYRLILVVSDYIGHEVLIGSISHSRIYLS